MTANLDMCPRIWGILDRFKPTQRNGRRAIKIERPYHVDLGLMKDVARELQYADLMAQLDSAEIATLAVAATDCLRR